MTRTLIRVDGNVPEALTSAFPHLVSKAQRAQTTLTGDIRDQEELQGVLNYLNSLGVSVVEVVTIPE